MVMRSDVPEGASCWLGAAAIVLAWRTWRSRRWSIEGDWVVTPKQHGDNGAVPGWFKSSTFTEITGAPLKLAQANCSVSARGSVRGIHYADVPPGQAKYIITCFTGAVLDVIVDIRVGSPTFGGVGGGPTRPRDRRAVFLSEGLGHGFAALEDDSTVAYLVQ